MSSQSFYILSPGSDQALAIAKWLRKYRPGDDVIAVTADGKKHTALHGLYHRSVPITLMPAIGPGAVRVPTGATSTQDLLKSGGVTIGQVTLGREALKVSDKQWAISSAAEAGLHTPTTWRHLTEANGFPLFYKQSHEHGGGDRGTARAERDVPVVGRDKLIFQELIKGDGTYGVAVLAMDGNLLAHCMHFERESLPKEGGSAVIIEAFEDGRLLDHTRRLIDALRYSGWGLVEYKYCPHRQDFVFMEVNAKFWASCDFTFRNNPMFVRALFDIDSLERPVRRMVFLERAMARGLPFIINHFRELVSGSAIQCRPGWLRREIAATLPTWLRRWLVRIVSRRV